MNEDMCGVNNEKPRKLSSFPSSSSILLLSFTSLALILYISRLGRSKEWSGKMSNGPHTENITHISFWPLKFSDIYISASKNVVNFFRGSNTNGKRKY